MQNRYTANPEMVFRDEGQDGAILFDPVTGAVKILNEVAAIIYKCLDGNHTKDEIVKRLQSAFPEVEKATLEQDVSDFIDEMKEKQLIEE